MKCTQCGSNDLISTTCLPLRLSGDAYLEVFKDNIYICKECGHLEFFNRYYIEKLNQEEQKNKEINDEKNKIMEEIARLKNLPFDEKYYQEKLKELKDEIAILEKLGVGGKAIRSRYEMLKECEDVLKEKKDPRIENQIRNLNNRLYELDHPYRNRY